MRLIPIKIIAPAIKEIHSRITEEKIEIIVSATTDSL